MPYPEDCDKSIEPEDAEDLAVLREIENGDEEAQAIPLEKALSMLREESHLTTL